MGAYNYVYCIPLPPPEKMTICHEYIGREVNLADWRMYERTAKLN